jgi:hypothetical protein
MSLSYESLKWVHENNKPYRGTDKYPITHRAHSYKHFVPQVVDGRTEYHVYYSWNWRDLDITNAEYDKLNISEQKNYVRKWGSTTHWTKWEKVANKIGIVRDDNTFEFVANNLHQGIRHFLTRQFRSNVYADCKRGGVILHNRYDGIFVPIYRGMVVDATSFKPVKDYEVIIRRVSRKDGKSALKQYEDFLKLAGTMAKASDRKQFLLDMADEVRRALGNDKVNRWISPQEAESLIKIAMDNVNTDEYGAMLMLCYADNVGWVRSAVEKVASNLSWGAYSSDAMTPESWFDLMKTKFSRKIYKEHDTFTKTVYKYGDRYPQSTWGVEVLVDGKEVDQYKS